MPLPCRLAFALVAVASFSGSAVADSLPADASYRPLPTLPFEETKANDEAQKPRSCSGSEAAAQRTLRPRPTIPSRA